MNLILKQIQCRIPKKKKVEFIKNKKRIKTVDLLEKYK